MRHVMFVSVCCGCVLSAGCGLFSAGREMSKASVDQFAPRTHDYRDDVNDSDEFVDPHVAVGREARGHLPPDHESDGLSKYIASPKARAIERSLGVD
jgi:hypothetical protein